MRLYMVSIFDKRAKEYGPPMCQHTLGTAERMFQDTVNDPQSPIKKHPEDYELYHIGFYETNTGGLEISDELEPRLICTATQLVQQ